MANSLPNLNARRKVLKMPIDVLVRRSGVPRAMVIRLLRGNIDSVRFGYVAKVTEVLGLSLQGSAINPEEFREHEARKKAMMLSRLTQGTMALEAQALSHELLNELAEDTVRKLLAGKGRKLWSE